MHTTVGSKASCIAAFQSAARQASAHYVVGLDGSLTQMVDEKDAAWHAGDYGVNLDSIGIEHEDGGNYNSPWPDALYKRTARLVADICIRYKLPCQRGDAKAGRSGCIDHRTVYATACPDSLDTNRIIREAAEYVAGRDPYAPPAPPVPEWKANAKPRARTTQLYDPAGVQLRNMDTGASLVPPVAIRSLLVTAYDTTVKGVEYAMTAYSYDHGVGNGFRLDELKAASVEPAPAPQPTPEPTPTPQPTPDPAPQPTPEPIPEVPPVADTTRTDLDALMAKIAELMAKGDGIEPGFLTTEFWLLVVALAADFAGPVIGLSLSSDERMYIAAGLVSVYGAFRAWRKRGGPAKLYADLLAKLAELRHAAA